MALRDGRVGGWLVNPRDKADALKTSGEGEGGAGGMDECGYGMRGWRREQRG